MDNAPSIGAQAQPPPAQSNDTATNPADIPQELTTDNELAQLAELTEAVPNVNPTDAAMADAAVLVADVPVKEEMLSEQPSQEGAEYIAPKDEDDDEAAGEVMVAAKLLIGSWLLKGAKPDVPGTSSPDPPEKSFFNIEVRFLYGKRKVKYEINQPGATLMIDYDFSAISGLAFKLDTKIMVVELSEAPTFSAREDSKWVKVLDFTHGNASYYRRHYIEFFVQNFSQHVERLLDFDPRLKQLAEFGLPEISNEPSFASAPQTLICDWDKENVALLHCVECGAQSYCAECDEVLHRPPDKRHHKRIPTHQMTSAEVIAAGAAATATAVPVPSLPSYQHAPPAQSYSPTSGLPSGGGSGKKRKRQKSERCRCGTGATKGTLGDPCTGNRCPCYSEGRGCSACGCKNCGNPHNDRDEKPSST